MSLPVVGGICYFYAAKKTKDNPKEQGKTQDIFCLSAPTLKIQDFQGLNFIRTLCAVNYRVWSNFDTLESC